MTSSTPSDNPISVDEASKLVEERPKFPVPRFIDYLDIPPTTPMSDEAKRQMTVEWLNLRGISETKTIEVVLPRSSKSLEVLIVTRDGVLSMHETEIFLGKMAEFVRETGIPVFTAKQRTT